MIFELIQDFHDALAAMPKSHGAYQALELLAGTLRLEAYFLDREPLQLPERLHGHLADEHDAIIRRLLAVAHPRWKSWLRPCFSCFAPPGGGLVHSLEGHIGGVHCVSFCGDQMVISAGSDRSLRIWDIETGKCLRVIEQDVHRVNALATFHQENYVVSGSRDTTLRIWDLANGVCISTLEGHTEAVTCLAVTGNDGLILSGSKDGTIRVWDTVSRLCVKVIQVTGGAISCFAVDNERQRIVVGSGNMLTVWDLASGECLVKHDCEWNISSLALVDNSERVFTGSANFFWLGTMGVLVREVDLATGTCIRKMIGRYGRVHLGDITSLVPNPDRHLVISTSKDNTLRVWNCKTGECAATLFGHTGEVISASLHTNGRILVSASHDRTLRVWDLDTALARSPRQGHFAEVHALDFHPESDLLMTASIDGTLKAWNFETGRFLRVFNGHTDGVWDVAITPNGQYAVSVAGGDPYYINTNDKTVKVWNIKTAGCLHSLEGHTAKVVSVSVFPDCRHALSGSFDTTLRVWDIDAGKCISVLKCDSPISTMVLHDDGRHVLAAKDEGCVFVYDIQTHALKGKLEGHTGYVSGIVLAQRGQRVLSVSLDGTLRVWEFGTFRCLNVLRTGKNNLTSVDVSPDCRYAFVTSADGFLTVWHLETGEALAGFHARESLSCCAFDLLRGRIIAAGVKGGLYFLQFEDTCGNIILQKTKCS